MAVRATHNFHLPLPDGVYQELREQAARLGEPATAVARRAIESWLARRRRDAVYEAVASYAEEMAGTGADLDEELEAAAVEHLLASEAQR